MHIESNTIQETLVIPLWGRKYCSDIYPELYNDPMAEKIMENLDYDFPCWSRRKAVRCSALAIWKPQQDIRIWRRR